jgi:FkbM family methyltransferase
MNKILEYLYNNLPKSIQYKIGKSLWLKKIRDFFLKSDGRYKESSVKIKKRYLNQNVEFVFYAAIKTAAQAKKSGIETRVLNNSIQLIDPYMKGKTDCVVLDIGANFGYLSLVWANTVAKNKGKVIAFEPNKHVYTSLNKSISRNKIEHIITLENKAVGNENKSIKLFIDNATSNTLPTENDVAYELVDMVSIDEYIISSKINSCNLVKIDVDGIEYQILQGCINLIELYKPIFIVETNNDDKIISFFNSKNYQILDMNLKPYKMSSEIPINIFCVPK